jgi:hypothetical protein
LNERSSENDIEESSKSDFDGSVEVIEEEKISAAKSGSKTNIKNVKKEESNNKKEQSSEDIDDEDSCLIISTKTRATILAKRKR